ncbi:MAG: hypothetical protein FJ399_01435 [Verrucomicrobia bacterium]|nr:hypothetical protein [Verrucomicrobiota bacterium]
MSSNLCISLHQSRGKVTLAFDASGQAFTSLRADERMHVELLGAGGFDLAQTDAWPLPPKTDYPMVTAPEPAPQWHLTATARRRASATRIVAVMRVAAAGEYPDCALERRGDGTVRLTGQTGGGKFDVDLDLDAARTGQRPLLQLEFRPPSGPPERLRLD